LIFWNFKMPSVLQIQNDTEMSGPYLGSVRILYGFCLDFLTKR